MPNTLIFTGNAGPGIASAAAGTALHSAERGHRTLLISGGHAHSLGTLLEADLTGQPRQVAPRFDALAIDPLAELAAVWERSAGLRPAGLAGIAGDELPLLPGLELSFGLLRLREFAPHYEVVVVDAGPHDLLLRALALPDGLRWAVRLLFGLDRGPGRSVASIGRALLPTSFIPSDTLENIQEARVQAERLRALVTGPGAAARYVLRPDRPAIEEARLAIAGLQLHGLAVQTIVVGPLLPEGLAGTPLAATYTQQAALLAQAAALWPARRLLRFDIPTESHEPGALRQIGAQLYASHQVLDGATPAAPIAEEWQGQPAVAIELPGMPKNALQLTLSGDELIVRLGPYRRHILLPDGLRGISSIKATREGDRLVVRRR